MQACFTWLLLLAVFVFVMMTLLRWFEQTAEAVDQRWWNKVLVLVAMPFAVWFFPSKVAVGRPTPVPRHEPVKGMGTAPKVKRSETPVGATPASPNAPTPVTDQPPPGTPKEFLGMPVIPPKQKAKKPPADPDKIAKLRAKMREQGMLDDE